MPLAVPTMLCQTQPQTWWPPPPSLPSGRAAARGSGGCPPPLGVGPRSSRFGWPALPRSRWGSGAKKWWWEIQRNRSDKDSLTSLQNLNRCAQLFPCPRSLSHVSVLPIEIVSCSKSRHFMCSKDWDGASNTYITSQKKSLYKNIFEIHLEIGFKT